LPQAGAIEATEMAAYGAERKLLVEIGCFRFCPIPLNKSVFE
jgi:hypothetical protein